MQTQYLQKQRGSVLLWGLVILLTMTVIGVAASRMAALDTRIAGNEMYYMLTYQGAESSLRRSVNTLQIIKTAAQGVYSTELGAKVFPVSFTDQVSGGQVQTTGESSMGEEEGCPPLRGVAISTEMSPESGGVACRVFVTDVDSKLSGTGASSDHAEGVLKLVPGTG